MNKSICLVGNPNCGKTTLFNLLTGSNQKVGNWAGVTTCKKEGRLKKDKRVLVTDLPGLYSLTPTSPDERVVVDFLKDYKEGVIINVIDGTNLKRNLFLTLSLIKLGIPMLVAVNMIDQLKEEGILLNTENLSKFLGVPVLPISAVTKEGVEELISSALTVPSVARPNFYINEEKYYSIIEKRIDEFTSNTDTKLKKNTEKIDKILTHSFFGFVVFAFVMLGVYFVSLKLGGIMGDKTLELLDLLGDMTAKFLLKTGVNKVSIDLLVNAVFKGVGSVLSFLPHLLIMFLLMTWLEGSGYTARVSLIFDRLFSRLGLSGKSVIPFVLACGCTVSGIEGARTIENVKEKELTVMLAPFLPCGAKSAVFGWFSYVFFGGNAMIALSLYLLSFAVVIVVAKLYSKKIRRGEKPFYVLELPPLRVPKIQGVMSCLWVHAREFLAKTGTVIFALSIGLWLLLNFGFSGYVAGDETKSFLYLLGNGIKYIFYPLGFGNWQASVSAITGILAKEAVVETMQILTSHPQTLFSNGFSVYAFMVFTLLSPPCVATLSMARRELNDDKKVLLMMGMEFVVAYLLAFLINMFGILISLDVGLILSCGIVIITLLILAFCVQKAIKGKCKGFCRLCGQEKCNAKNDVRLYERGGQ